MTAPRELDGKGGRREGETVAAGIPAHQLGPPESLAHSVDYVDPQVWSFPMAERAHNPAIANDVDVVPLGCLRAILDQLTRRRLRVQTRTFLYWTDALRWVVSPPLYGRSFYGKIRVGSLFLTIFTLAVHKLYTVLHFLMYVASRRVASRNGASLVVKSARTPLSLCLKVSAIF